MARFRGGVGADGGWTRSRLRTAMARLLVGVCAVGAGGILTVVAAAPAAYADTTVNGCAIVANPSSSHYTDCPNANLSTANLEEMDLSYANLSYANLSGANLSSGDLSGANLSGADLSGAMLDGANLSGADLSGAGLSGAILNDAYVDVSSSVFPLVPGSAVGESPNGLPTAVSWSFPSMPTGLNTPVCVPASGSLFPIGITIVSCTVSTSAGTGGLAQFPVVVSASQTFTLGASATSVVAGGTLMLTGSGVIPGSAVTLTLHSTSTSTSLGTITATTGGTFNTQVTLPADTAPGTYTFIANTPGQTSNALTVQVSAATFTLGESATSVVAGGTLTITGSGVIPGSMVTLSLHSTPVTLGTVAASLQGTFRTVVTIPATATAGAHTITASSAAQTANTLPLTVTAKPITTAVTTTPIRTATASAASATGELADTGTDLLPGLIIALGVLLAGSALLLIRRTARR